MKNLQRLALVLICGLLFATGCILLAGCTGQNAEAQKAQKAREVEFTPCTVHLTKIGPNLYDCRLPDGVRCIGTGSYHGGWSCDFSPAHRGVE